MKKIENYTDYYINNDGSIISYKYKEPKTLKQTVLNNGYASVKLSNNGKTKTHYVHHLVAIAFLNHTPNGYAIVVDHIDNNPLNNNVNNLQLITNRENTSKDKKNKTSKYIGVSWDKRVSKWQCNIKINGKRLFLGRYKTEKIAAAVYLYALENL